ncbi:MAG: substrate-binding domain-containing protein, partial [Dehalococcoidia bacterium]
MLMAASLAMACSSNNNNSRSANNAAATVASKSATVASTATTVAATTAGGSAGPSAAAVASVAACPPSGAANSLTGAGSTFDAPLFSKLFDTYNTQCKVQVNYQSVGSGAGIQQLAAKTVQFGATDAPMTDQQIKDAGGGVLHIPITIGAVSIGYNLPGVKSGVKLSGASLAGIFLGKIKKWNDPALTA